MQSEGQVYTPDRFVKMGPGQTLGEHIIKKSSFFILVTICCAMISFLHAEEGVINRQMEAALKNCYPKFIVWRTQDYTPTVQQNAVRKRRLPYALELDVNGDRKIDLILDGHGDQHSVLLCLLSKSNGYNGVVIRTGNLVDPKKLEHSNDGKKEIGLNYFLWPNKERTGFTLAFPQQSDSKGNLLKDGAMIDYIFKNGTFHESCQIL
jgi:hypothetical protein